MAFFPLCLHDFQTIFKMMQLHSCTCYEKTRNESIFLNCISLQLDSSKYYKFFVILDYTMLSYKSIFSKVSVNKIRLTKHIHGGFKSLLINFQRCLGFYSKPLHLQNCQHIRILSNFCVIVENR